MTTQETITFTLPELGEGEIYIGTLITNSQREHIILLPGDLDDSDWNTAKAWAQEQGGDLPTRTEQALMFATQRDEFKRDWYWSGELRASASAFAWITMFSDGIQLDDHVNGEYRARAVRRLPI